MTSVSQKIPNYVGGISQQPDELMPPGMVKEALNVIPDVTNGLIKRPGARLLNPLQTNQDSGSWFHINRDRKEQYLGKVEGDGRVMVFDLLKQAYPIDVEYSSEPIDFYPDSGEIEDIEDDPDFQPPTVECNYQKMNDNLEKYYEELQDLTALKKDYNETMDRLNDGPNPGEEAEEIIRCDVEWTEIEEFVEDDDDGNPVYETNGYWLVREATSVLVVETGHHHGRSNTKDRHVKVSVVRSKRSVMMS